MTGSLVVRRGLWLAPALLIVAASGCERRGSTYTVHGPEVIEVRGDPSQYQIAESMVVHALAAREPPTGDQFSIPSLSIRSRSWTADQASGGGTVARTVTTFQDEQGRSWRVDRVMLPGPVQTVTIWVSPPLSDQEEAAMVDRWRTELEARGFRRRGR